nr:molybdate ABC transporter ATP-binding protein ModF [Candidatus Pantoea persica]
MWLADGATQLNVALTQRSVERLQLEPGKEVLVLNQGALDSGQPRRDPGGQSA